MAKTKFTSGVTIVTADIANSWFGGLAGTPEGAALPANDPRVTGHVHDGSNRDGSSSKVNLVSHVTGQLNTANIANSAITNAKIANATITESKLAFSITDPIVGPETFIFRPSGVREGNIYNTFSDLYTDFSATSGTKVIVFDTSLIAGNAVIPAGTYDFEDAKLTGAVFNNDVTTVGHPAIDLSSGVTIVNLRHVDSLTIINKSTSSSPIQYTSGSIELLRMTNANISSDALVVGVLPAIKVSGGSNLTMLMSLSSNISSINGTTEVINVSTGLDTLSATLTGRSIVSNDTLLGGGVVVASVDPSSNFGLTQTAFTGSLPASLTLFGEGSRVKYDPSVLPTTLVSTNSQDAIDEVFGLITAYGLPDVLAVDNTSSGSNILMQDNDEILLGTDSDGSVGYGSALNTVNIITSAVSDVAASPGSSHIALNTGNRINTDPSLVGPNSGNISIATGITRGDVGGAAGDSGQITLQTGASTTSAGNSGNTGDIALATGNSDDAISGEISIDTGNGVESGQLTLSTGTGNNNGSGLISIVTGTATVIDSGQISIATGAAGTFSGDVVISTGNATTDSGDITITAGTAGGTRGLIGFSSESIDINTTLLDSTTQAITWDLKDDEASSLKFKNQSAAGRSILTLSTSSSTNDILKLGTSDSDVSTSPQKLAKITVGRYSDLTYDTVNLQARKILNHEFELRPMTSGSYAFGRNPYFGTAGLNAVDASVDISSIGISMVTAGASGDQVVVSPAHSGTPSADSAWHSGWVTDDRITAGTLLKLSQTTDVRVEFGFRNTTTAFDDTTDDEKMIMRYDSSASANWFLVTSNAGVETTTDSGIAATTNLIQIKMVVNASNEVSLIIDDAVVLLNTNTLRSGTFSMGNLYFGIKSQAIAAKTMNVAKVSASRRIT